MIPFSFTSQFKINGVPILPPLMTPEVRSNAAFYRKKAIEIEQRLQTKRNNAASAVQDCCYENETEKLPGETEPQGTSDEKVLYRSVSFSLDAPTPGLPDLPNTSLLDKEKDSPKACVEQSDDESPRPRLIRSNSYTLDSPSPLLMKHMHNQSLNIKSSASMDEMPKDGAKSYVKKLDFESKVPPKKLSKSGSKPKWVSTKKVSPKAIAPVKKHKSPYGPVSRLSSGKGKNKANGKTISAEQKSTPIQQTALVQPAFNDCQKKIKEIQAEHEKRVKELLKRQEEEQLQLQENFRRQQEELLKMLPVPLVDQIHTSTPLLTSPNESMLAEDTKPSFRQLNISSKDFVQSSESQSSIGNLSSSQTLFVSSDTSRTSIGFESSDELYRTCENNMNSNRALDDINGNFQFHGMRNYIETISQSLQDKELQQLTPIPVVETRLSGEHRVQHHAASVINAHVRGYLTRRLFQTDHVQKVVQVIRDTLLFILDLHHEKTARQQFRSPADVQLKKTLLHQLTSACYQLHKIFFESTVQQRMELIRRDRETLRRRLENRPRTASSVGSGRSGKSSASAGASRKQLTYSKLQICSLYSVNIEGTANNDEENNNSNQAEEEEEAAEVPIGDSSRSSKKINTSITDDHTKLRHSSPSVTFTRSLDSASYRPATNLSAAVVTRLVNQVKKASNIHCPAKADLRPKTTEDAFIGGAPNRRISRTQKYF